MASDGSPKSKTEIKEESASATSVHQLPLEINTSQRRLLNEKDDRKKILASLNSFNFKMPGFSKFRGLSSPSTKFRHFAEEREEFSRSITSPVIQASPLHTVTSSTSKVNWNSLFSLSKVWIRDPMNIALLAWMICVAVSGAILFMVMTGMLNAVLPKKSQRNTWFEVNNQILNALFTLMCLYQHPKRFYYLVLLCRFNGDDVLKLRKIYCKNGTYKPNEWIHMMVVVGLLHLNCFAQYALCGLNLGFPRSRRPAIGVGLTISVAIGAPIIAMVYNMLSPLGKDYDIDVDLATQRAEEGQRTLQRMSSRQKRYSFMLRDELGVQGSGPQWIGGLFDLWDDISVAYLSLFCGFCVFGWNMDRLGFGNMYVHIATFVLFCLAPFWIFNLAAINIDNEVIRESLGLTGIFLCVLGLFYGGFWRIRMRKRFNLPGNTWCCGNASATDCFQWLCCCFCSLAQEVRTADFYEVVEDKLYRREDGDYASGTPSPLPREDAQTLFRSAPSSPYRGNNVSPSSVFWLVSSPSPGRVGDEYAANGGPRSTPETGEYAGHAGKGKLVAPPVTLGMKRDAEGER